MDVLLRQVTAADLPLLDAWRGDPDAEGEFNDFGLARTRSTVEGNHLVVEVDGQPIGTVSWQDGPRRCPTTSRAPSTSASPSSRQRAGRITVPSPSACSPRHLFATTPVNRVEASTDRRRHRRAEVAGARRLHPRAA